MSDISITKKQKKIYSISESGWLAIGHLLEHKYSIQEIDSILKLGIHLDRLADQSWIHLTKGKLAQEISKYSEIFPLHQAIELGYQSFQLREELMKGIVKQSIYPIFLIVLSSVLLLVFSQLILPQMLSMMDTSSLTLLTLITLVKILTIGFIVLLVFSLLVTCFLGLKIKDKTSNKQSLLNVKIVQEYASYHVMIAYKQLVSYKLSTKDSLDYLEKLCKDTLAMSLVNNLKQSMSKGLTFSAAIESSNLSILSKEFFILGMNANDVLFFIDLFLRKQKDDWTQTIKKFNLKLQLAAYSMVAIIVFVVYQIMLMPLDMLQGF